MFLNYSFSSVFLLVNIFISKHLFCYIFFRDSYAGAANESTCLAGKISAEIVVDGGMRCFFLIAADISLKVFVGWIL